MNENKFLFKKDGAFLFVIISIHIICWIAMKPIFPEGDPLVYFVNAERILNHEYFISYSIHSHRYGVFIPQAILIHLFGKSPYIINLWVLLCSLSTLSLVYFFVLRYIARGTAFISGLLLSVNLIQIIYSSIVFSDLIVSLFILLCIYFLHKGRLESQHWLKNSLLFIASFALGFSAKESIVVILPFVGFIFWQDWRKKMISHFQKSASVLLILFAVFVFVLSKILMGDFLFFYDSYSHYTVYLPLNSFGEILKHISYLPLLWFNAQLGYVFIMLFSIPAFVSGIIKKDAFKSVESLISLYTVVLLLTLWCASISLFHFGYIPMVDRRWMILIAPLCILSAITIHGIIRHTISKRSFYFLVVAFILLGVFNAMTFTFIRGALFFAFALMLIVQQILIKKLEKNYLIRVFLIVLPFFILAIQFLRTNSNYVMK